MRGTATLEAVLVLLVLVLIYVGIVHIAKLQNGVLVARAHARKCAWQYSSAGCRGAMPAGCESGTTRQTSLDSANDDDRSLLDSFAALGPFDVLFQSVLGTSVDLGVTQAVPATRMLDAHEMEVGARIYLLCNERNRSAQQIAKDTACALMPGQSFMGSVLGCGGDRPWQ